MKWEAWFRLYLERHCTARGLRSKTIAAYKDSLEQFRTFARFRWKEIEPDSITLAQVLDYVNYLRKERANGDAAVNRQVTILKCFYRAIVAMEQMEPAANPMAHFPRLKPPKRKFRDILTGEEIKRLVDTPSTDTQLGLRDRTLLILIYGTGIRVSECAGLTEKDVDLMTRTLRVVGKGGSERTVPLSETVKKALEQYRTARGSSLPNTPFFRGRNGGGITRGLIYERVRRAAGRASISKRVSPHTLRHSFATHLIRNGENLITVRDLLGHRQVSSTQIYLHMTAEDLRNAIERHPIGRLIESLPDLLPDVKLPFQHAPRQRQA